MKTLTVLAPVYNEEVGITDFYLEVSKVLSSIQEKYESSFLFVVDQCSDNSLLVLKKIAAQDKKVKILSLSSRFGHQKSILAGIDYAATDIIIMLDSDLQHPPKLIPSMLEKYEEGYDIVYMVKSDYQATSFFRRLTSRLFYRFLQHLSNSPIYENSSDFRLITCRVANIFRTQIRERNLFLRGMLSWVGFPSCPLEFKVEARQHGKSKYTFYQMLNLALWGILGFSKKPIRLASILGLFFSTLGFIYGFYAVISYLVEDSQPRGWVTLAVLVSILGGIQLLCLGILGEYIGAIFEEVKQRPHYIVDEKINFPTENT